MQGRRIRSSRFESSPQGFLATYHAVGCKNQAATPYTGGPGGDITAPGTVPSGLSPGDVMLIIFFCGFGVYFIIGILVKRFHMGETGAQMIPNVEFWSGLPGLVKDGFMFLINKCRGRNTEYSKM